MKTIICTTRISAICLAFGVFVSYSDFWSGKEIICFLTMVIYVGCLLIYRPFVTVLILGASFLFLDIHNFKAFNDQRGFEAGDKFLITIGKFVSDIFHEEAQAAFLNKIGCTRLQGYLFGKPIPKEELYQRIDKKELTVSDHLL